MFKYNPFTDKLDKVNSEAEIHNMVADDYVNVTGDTMTGALTVTAAGYSEFAGGIKLKAGQKLIFDGDN